MRAIKIAIVPSGILNPGKVLVSRSESRFGPGFRLVPLNRAEKWSQGSIGKVPTVHSRDKPR